MDAFARCAADIAATLDALSGAGLEGRDSVGAGSAHELDAVRAAPRSSQRPPRIGAAFDPAQCAAPF